MTDRVFKCPEINFVFFGTPEPAVQILDALKSAGFLPSAVATAPDRPKGRGLRLSPSPVKEWALKNGIEVLQPVKMTNLEFVRKIKALKTDIFIVVAFGSLLPKELLAVPAKGALNIHYSLLPKYRGASPIESQILNDDRNTGISILLLDEKMDHGPVVAEKEITVLPWPPSAVELRKISSTTAGKLLVDILPGWMSGSKTAVAQDDSRASYSPKFRKSDGEINLSDDPYKNYLKIQAFAGSIGTHFFVERKGKKIRVSIKQARYENGNLVISRVVPEGKKEIGYDVFMKGLV